jgi:hypothetical protein
LRADAGNSGSGAGKPFALIVPSDATVGVGGGENIVETCYFLATTQTLNLSDFNASVRTASQTGGSGFAASIEPVNVGLVAPLAPGQIGGANFSPVLNSFLLPGETFKNAGATFYQLRISYPEGNTITQTLSASITLIDHKANFTTTLHYNPNTPLGYQVNAGQRVTAVQIPEPSMTTSAVGLVMRRWLMRRWRTA